MLNNWNKTEGKVAKIAYTYNNNSGKSFHRDTILLSSDLLDHAELKEYHHGHFCHCEFSTILFYGIKFSFPHRLSKKEKEKCLAPLITIC